MFIHFVKKFGVQSQHKCLITIRKEAPSINLTLAMAMLMEAPDKLKFIQV